jgi:hypothetical protein
LNHTPRANWAHGERIEPGLSEGDPGCEKWVDSCTVARFGDQPRQRRDPRATTALAYPAVLHVDGLTLAVLANDQSSIDGAREREGCRVITDDVAIVDALSGRRRHNFVERGARLGARVPRADKNNADEQ